MNPVATATPSGRLNFARIVTSGADWLTGQAQAWYARVVAPRASIFLFAGLLVEAIGLAAMLPVGDFRQPGMAVRFMAVAAVAVAGYAIACLGLNGSRRRDLVVWGWAVAIAFRVVLLFMYPGDDIWRYLWEGKIQRFGINPYAVTSTSAAMVPYRDAYSALMNGPDAPAVYPPVTLGIFRGLATVWYDPRCFKLAFLLADLGVVWVVRRLLALRGMDGRRAWWYAWNPLAIYAYAGGGHFDSLMILCMIASLWLLLRGDEGLSVGCLVLAISLKLVGLLVVPFYLVSLRRKRWLGLLALLAIPLVLLRFKSTPSGNDMFWWLLRCVVYAAPGAVLLYVKFRRRPLEGSHHVLLWLLMVSPQFHPWYLPWFLCLSPLVRGKAWWVLAASVFAYFWIWHRQSLTGVWTCDLPERLVIWIPYYCVLVPELLVPWLRRRRAGGGDFVALTAQSNA